MHDIRDLGKWYGFKQSSAADIGNPMQVGPDMGWTITNVQDKFFYAYDFYKNLLGWSNAEILDRTLFTLAYNNSSLYGATVLSPHECKNFPIYIPSGRWYYNSELRSGQSRNIGAGSTYNFGNGGTELRELTTDWKSIYGAQNDDFYMGFVPWVYTGESNLSVMPLGWTGGYEWSHHFTVEKLRMNGQAGTVFRDPSRTSIGVMYYNPGERSGVYDCEIDDYNDVGVLVSHTPAPATLNDNSFFRNRVGMVGIRGCARSQISIDGISGDFSPYVIIMFRGGHDIWGTGAYMPHALAINPGGTLIMKNVKMEDSCCRSGYLGHTGCTPSMFTGKGMMLGRFTGRFQVKVDGLTASNYSGRVDSLCEVIDDYQAGYSIPLNNSSVSIHNAQTIKFDHWLHDMSANEKYQLNPLDTDSQRTSFKWQKGFPLQKGICPDTGEFYPVTPASYDGRLPYLNQGQIWVQDHNNPPGPGKNYNVVTGANY